MFRGLEYGSLRVMADILVAGGGPAGMAAAVMARSLAIDVLLLEPESIGGRLSETPRIENVPELTSGPDYAEAMQRHGIELELPVTAAGIASVDVGAGYPVARLTDGTTLTCRHLVWAVGLRPRTSSEVTWIANGAKLPTPHLVPSEAVRAVDHDEMVVVGGDRPLGTFLRSSRVKSLPRIHVLYRPEEKYKLEELKGGRWPLEYYEIEQVVVSPKSHGVIISCVTTDRRELSFDNAIVRMNLGYVPNDAPIEGAVVLADNGYPSRCPPCISVVGDAAHERCQRISVALGEGAKAVLDWYYPRVT